jgi:hypothetical protein
MSIELLEQGRATLGEIANAVVVVEGSHEDVDVIVDVANAGGLPGLRGAPARCRLSRRRNGYLAMGYIVRLAATRRHATEAPSRGFENRWQREAFRHSVDVDLPSGARIRAVPPPFLLATNVEAYSGRGQTICLAAKTSPRSARWSTAADELPGEVQTAPRLLRACLADNLGESGGDSPRSASPVARLVRRLGGAFTEPGFDGRGRLCAGGRGA